jgi:hypothetical protein
MLLLLKKLPPWDLMDFASMVDISWYALGSCYGRSRRRSLPREPNCYRPVKGFQGDDLKARNTILACAKHYCGFAELEL